MVRKRYLSIFIALFLIAFPATAGAAPLFDLPGTGSLAPEDNSDGYVAVDPSSGTLIATSGFDVKRDGFSFPNWGESSEEHRRSLTPTMMQSLYGDTICARITDGQCVLSATGEALQADLNDGAAGGHCFGFAALAGLFATGQLDTSSYLPAGQTVYESATSDQLDGLISRYFSTQFSSPTQETEERLSVADLIAQLETTWAQGGNYIIGIYGDVGGHAITPIALRDLGDGKTGIVVYDNNFPGVEKMVVTDAAANTWYYTTALNPADKSYLFVGSPDNEMTLLTLPQTKDVHECPICREAGDDSTLVLVKDMAENLDGSMIEWQLSVTGPGGGELAGVEKVAPMNTQRAVLFRVPAGTPFAITIDDVPLGPITDIDISLYGDGWMSEIDGIALIPGASATVNVNKDQRKLALNSTIPLQPTVITSTEQADWSVSATGTGLKLLPGSTLTLQRDVDGNFVYGLTGIGLPGSIDLNVKRRDSAADHVVATRGPVSIPVNASASVAAENWNGSSPLTVQVSGNGTNQTYPMVAQ